MPGQAGRVPFTVSHAIAVLPLVRNRRLVPAALVIGSWVPDLPYFVPFLGRSGWTHAASGPVTIDLLLGLLVLVLWKLLMRRPLVDLAPGQLRERVPPPRRLDLAYLLGAAVSVVIGAVTHVMWDTFTHPDRWGTTHLAVLTDVLGPLPVFKWLQFASGVLGLLGLLLWLASWLRQTPRRPLPSRVQAAVRRGVWVSVVALSVLVAVLVAAANLAAGRSLEAVAFAAVTRALGAAAAAIIVFCLVWLLSQRRAGSGSEQGPAPQGRG